MKLLTFILLAIAMAVAGCAKPPSRTVTGGSASTLTESAQTAVPPSYPPAYPRRVVQYQQPFSPEAKYQSPAPITTPAPEAIKAPATQPSQQPFGVAYTETDFYPPIPVSPPTILERSTATTATTQPSSTIDIVTPKSWGGYWIGLCLLIAAGCAVAATVTPIKRLYLVAGAAAALASLALVPPAYLGAALLITVVVLLAGVAWFAYRSGVWKVDAKRAETNLAQTSVALNQVVAGVEKVKATIGAKEEINTLLAIEQDRSTKDLIRKARGK